VMGAAEPALERPDGGEGLLPVEILSAPGTG